MMTKFNDNAIREAAYYIWQNNGCQANSSAYDWNAAINQLSAASAINNGRKKVATKSAAPAMVKAAVALKSSATPSKKMPQIVLTSKKSK